METLSAKIIVVERIFRGSSIRVVDLNSLRRVKDLNVYLAKLWFDNGIVVSHYIAEVVMDNLTVRRRHELGYEYTYCYGRVKRVLRRLSIRDVIRNSRIIGIPLLHSSGREMMEMVFEHLECVPVRWPWMVLGLVIDFS